MRRKIDGFCDYSVSDDGAVYNDKTGRRLKPSKSNRYSSVCLRANGISKGKLVHRLVAIAFIKNPENKPEVNHIDGNRRNNKASNLEWVTRSENMKHAHATGLCKSENSGFFVTGDARRNDKSKLTNEQVISARLEYKEGSTIKSLALKHGVDYSNMRRIVRLQSYKNVV